MFRHNEVTLVQKFNDLYYDHHQNIFLEFEFPSAGFAIYFLIHGFLKIKAISGIGLDFGVNVS